MSTDSIKQDLSNKSEKKEAEELLGETGEIANILGASILTMKGRK